MIKFTVATLVFSAGLATCADISQAGWCKSRSCCTPAPTCAAPAGCAPVSSPAEPAGSATTETAPLPAPVPPVATNPREPALTGKSSQSSRSYSYDPAPSGIVNYGDGETTNPAPSAVVDYGAPPSAKPKSRKPASNFFSAGRKAEGIRR